MTLPYHLIALFVNNYGNDANIVASMSFVDCARMCRVFASDVAQIDHGFPGMDARLHCRIRKRETLMICRLMDPAAPSSS
jgi:hypothetical protein